MRPSANRHKTTTDDAPRANAGDSSAHDHAGQLGSTTHSSKKWRLTTPGASPRTHRAPIGTVGRVAPRPATATQKQTSSDTTTRQTNRG